jgi:hypothetical protein
MRVRVGYHGRCFDGCTSAALFTRFYTDRIRPGAEVGYRPLAHQKGLVVGENELDGDENAVVDFKYTASPRLTWWFDHHQSAFSSPEQREHFDRTHHERKFFDPHCSSCTKLIATVTSEKWNHRYPGLEELIHWADIIDAARFETPAVAVELKEPALQLMTVIEASDDAFCDALIPKLAQHGLAVAKSEDVQARFQPMVARHRQTEELVKQRARCHGGVVHFDLSECHMDGFNKFIGYYLHPGALYSVGVTLSDRRSKVSVGSNPWKKELRRHDLARICEKYGGGGHPAVGAVTLPASEVEEARRIAVEITKTLQG